MANSRVVHRDKPAFVVSLWVLGDVPRGCNFEVSVEDSDCLEQRLVRSPEVEVGETLGSVVAEAGDAGNRQFVASRDSAVLVAMHEGADPVDEVAEASGEVHVGGLDDPVYGEVGVSDGTSLGEFLGPRAALAAGSWTRL